MRVVKKGIRFVESRLKGYFHPTNVRERWVQKYPLKTKNRSGRNVACFGGLAAIPSREDALSEMIASVIGQFDHLYVYLNGFDAVPEFLEHPKITIFRSQETGDLGDVGKFFGTQYVHSGVYFTLDDDIVYPSDYRDRMLACLQQFDYRAAVGVHGAFYTWNPESFFDRQVIHYRAANSEIRPVSLLGTGTVCFSLDHLKVDLNWFRSANMADIWFGGHLKRHGFPALCIDREAEWLSDAVSAVQAENASAIYHVTKSDPEPYNRALAEFGTWGRDDLLSRIGGHSNLVKRFSATFAVPDFPKLLHKLQSKSEAERALHQSFLAIDRKRLTEQDVGRYFDGYECCLWSLLLAHESNPDYLLALAVFKRAMPVGTEAVAASAKQLMAVASSRKNRREMLRAGLLHMRALHRMEQWAAMEDAYRLMATKGVPSVQIALEYLISLAYREKWDEAHRYYLSSVLLEPYRGLAGVLAWLADPERVSVVKVIESFAELEKTGQLRQLRSHMFKWAGAVSGQRPSELSPEALEELTDLIDALGRGESMIKLLVVAGARSVARHCFRELVCKGSFGGLSCFETELLAVYVSEPGSDVVEQLNEIYRSQNVSTIGKKSAGGFFESLIASAPTDSVSKHEMVSVIMTCKDAETTIGYAVQSVLNQSYRNLELIIVDDGSSDTTPDIIKRFCLEDNRVKSLRNQDNLGIYASRNKAIKIAKGEYIAFQDADDYSHPQRLELQLSCLQSSPQKLASNSGHIRISPEGEVCLENNLNVLGHGPVNWIYRKSVFEAIGGFEEVRTRGDIEFINRLRIYYGAGHVERMEIPLLLAMHDMKTNSWRESAGDKVGHLLKQRQSHASQHYVTRHQRALA